jgi:hypothetical protein
MGNLTSTVHLKSLIQSSLGRFGYRLEKIRQTFPGENFYILDFALHILNQKRGGRIKFLQIGANDGLQSDPCYPWLRLYPWQGVLVEPQPALANRLREMYRERQDIVIEQALVADRSGELDFYYLEHPDLPAWATSIARLDRACVMARREAIPWFGVALGAARGAGGGGGGVVGGGEWRGRGWCGGLGERWERWGG